MLLRQRPRATRGADTARLPLAGGEIEDFAAFEAHALRTKPAGVETASMRALLRNHGARYAQVLRTQDRHADIGACIPDTTTLLAEIRHAVEDEMAVKLEDVVMRRTELAAGSHPGRRALEAAAMEMAQHMRWADSRMREELSATERTLARHLARVPSRLALRAADVVRPAHHGHGAMLANSRR
jgi:glycerol-3-phosphate dehydrogenase